MVDKQTPVLIYTPGRVSSGSCSIALAKAGFENKHHVHIMNEEWRKYSGAASPEKGMRPQQEKRYHHDRKIRKDIIDSGEKALIISFIREPLTRNMSAFFMNRVDKKGVDDKTTEGLRRVFLKRYPHYAPLEWLEREFNPVLGVDVYANPFPKDVGYSQLENDRYKILLLRTEMSNELKSQALSEFLDCEIEMEVSRKNDKYELKEETNELYRGFKNEVKFRSDFLDYLYQSKYVQHFIPDHEIEELRARWQDNDAIDVKWRHSPSELADAT